MPAIGQAEDSRVRVAIADQETWMELRGSRVTLRRSQAGTKGNSGNFGIGIGIKPSSKRRKRL
jgi:hypothetical protein